MNEQSQLDWYLADLHIHSVLSPCASLEMGPKNIVKRSQELGLKIIGICDHNSGANVPAFIKRASDKNLLVLPGMEVETREEVHCLCFFPDLDNLKYFEKEFKDTLSKINNDPRAFGDQVIVDENEEIIYEEKNLLLVSSTLGIKELFQLAGSFGGKVIPAHIDKKSYSLIFNLGFIPPYDFLAMEIFNYNNRGNVISNYSEINEFSLVVSSDAHNLEDMEKVYGTYFFIAKPSWQEVIWALQGQKGREVGIFSQEKN